MSSAENVVPSPAGGLLTKSSMVWFVDQYLGPDGLWVDDPQSDLGRIRRNHEFLTIFAKTMKARGLTEPLRANAVLGNLVHQVTIDRRFRVGTMAGLLPSVAVETARALLARRSGG